MFERKITKQLNEWYNQSSRQALIIEGARQVGKTFIIHKFAKMNYHQRWIEINFILTPKWKDLFVGDITGEALYTKFSLMFRDIFKSKGRILLFLDEIQACPEAITALKSFTIDGRIDVIASGSLLGVHYNQVTSFPVGYVERIVMYPMDFEEFLWANEHQELIEIVKNRYQEKQEIPQFYHEIMLDLFVKYIVIGGMPEVLKSYMIDTDFNRVLKIQKKIVEDYRSDIAKYATSSERVRAREVFDSIPFQLGKDNKKFQYKHISKGGRSSTYEGSIQWLIDAGIVYKCNALSHLEIPLISYKLVDSFKLYMMDIGLLVSMLGIDAQTKLLFDDLGIAKGAVYENVIAVLLKMRGYDLYYYERPSGLEIDFVLSKESNVVAIEVKSGDNTRSKSLQTLLSNQDIDYGMKLSKKNLSVDELIIRLPLYLAMFM
jgi:uncharacterized protein